MTVVSRYSQFMVLGVWTKLYDVIDKVPFACSGGSLAGLSTCMKVPSLESVATFTALVTTGAFFGNVDATYHMRHDKVFIFSGQQDSVVHPGEWELWRIFWDMTPPYLLCILYKGCLTLNLTWNLKVFWEKGLHFIDVNGTKQFPAKK